MTKCSDFPDKECPFSIHNPRFSFFRNDLKPEDPCPVCGELGTFGVLDNSEEE